MHKLTDKELKLPHAMVQHAITKHNIPESYHDELLSAANFGICVALRKFDPLRNVKFSTYAFNWIRKEISKAVEELYKDRGKLLQESCFHDNGMPKVNMTLSDNYVLDIPIYDDEPRDSIQARVREFNMSWYTLSPTQQVYKRRMIKRLPTHIRELFKVV